MAIRYAKEFQGVKDGTLPAGRLDGRLVSSKKRRIRAVKDAVADAIGDQVYVGKLPQGSTACEFRVNSDTALGSTTLSFGTLTNPNKYVAAKTVATTDVPAIIGPKATAMALAPLANDEDIYVTIGGTAMPAAAIVVFETVYTISA